MQQNNSQIKKIQFDNALLIPEIIKFINKGHTVTLRLKGFSMRPFLEDNRDSALLTKPTDIKVGDAVLAEISPLRFVLHRIVRIDGNNVTLRGDGNLGDEHCTLTDIKASVLGFYRKGRTRLDSTKGLKWRTYSFVWMHLFPIRRYLLAAYRKIWLKFFKPI